MSNDRKYKIVPYNPNWSDKFTDESQKIIQTIGEDNITEFHHIGSTSVPGMSGKSTIDILFVVKSIEDISNKVPIMQKLNYVSRGSVNAKKSHLFEKEEDGYRAFIIHFYEEGHSEIFQILAIRDYLRAHDEKVMEYSRVKLSLYKKYANDYAKYRALKDEYMQTLKENAYKWADFDIEFERAVRLIAKEMPDAEKLIKPTLLHSVRVGLYLYNLGYSREICIAGTLHDALEDTSIAKEKIRQEFGGEILELVMANSKNLEINKKRRGAELIERCAKHSEDALIIKVADILDNLKYFKKIGWKAGELKMKKYAKLVIDNKPKEYKDSIFTLLKDEI